MFGLPEADALNEAMAPHRIVGTIHSWKLRNTCMGELYADPATQPTLRCLSAMCMVHSSQDSRFPVEACESARESGSCVGRKLTLMNDLREVHRYRSPNTNMALPEVTAKY